MKSKDEDETNYGFLIKCLGALAAAAVIAAGVAAALALKASTGAAAGLAASASLALIIPAIIPIVGIILLVSAICLLPFMFGRSGVYAVSTPSYGYGGGYYPGVYQPAFYQRSSSYPATHVHSSQVHGHGGGGFHSHQSPGAPPTNVHGHR